MPFLNKGLQDDGHGSRENVARNTVVGVAFTCMHGKSSEAGRRQDHDTISFHREASTE